jgi:hypothetical protein
MNEDISPPLPIYHHGRHTDFTSTFLSFKNKQTNKLIRKKETGLLEIYCETATD